ncbi:MCE family protein [Rhodococcus sp. USK13]|uniref:MCE family protein n=1 Tax=Rhodococcus sp. USK13 TaxID=2806442 RepID=UPI001BCD76A4|nr:MCE family protein [Rhodococcus sp. USK13]
MFGTHCGTNALQRKARLRLCAAVVAIFALPGCGTWKGANSLPLPGTSGGGDGSYTIFIEMPNVTSIQQNSRVRVADVDVGTITDIQLQNWHALVTARISRDVVLPENATAKVGQTSLLGALHIELAPPLGQQSSGQLTDGDTIPLDHAGAYPTTEQTLASLSTVLNGGGLAQLQDINTELNAALSGHESQIRDLLGQLDTFSAALEGQKNDIISAAEGLDRLAGTVDRQNAALTTALNEIPPALRVLNEQKTQLSDAITAIGRFAAVAEDVTNASYNDLVANLRDIRPTLAGLANAGPALTRSLGAVLTPPFAADNVTKVIRGDYANLTATIDLTLGRIDNSMLQGTPFDGHLTAIETAMGRTEGRTPATQTTNPLTAPLSTVVQRGN